LSKKAKKERKGSSKGAKKDGREVRPCILKEKMKKKRGSDQKQRLRKKCIWEREARQEKGKRAAGGEKAKATLAVRKPSRKKLQKGEKKKQQGREKRGEQGGWGQRRGARMSTQAGEKRRASKNPKKEKQQGASEKRGNCPRERNGAGKKRDGKKTTCQQGPQRGGRWGKRENVQLTKKKPRFERL